MTFDTVSSLFTGVAAKKLSAVEASRAASNQHELNGVTAFRRVLGEPSGHPIEATFAWIDDDSAEAVLEEGSLTYYDARLNHPTRSELRIYYPASIAMTQEMQPGDVVFLARRRDGHLLMVACPADSTVSLQLHSIFGTALEDTLVAVNDSLGSSALSLAALDLFEKLGVNVRLEDDSLLERLHARFGMKFPETRVFSATARQWTPGVYPRDDPDAALIEWLRTEEIMFRTFEKHVAEEELVAMFEGPMDVDRFLQVSLSLHNRRKSRAGKSLENHLYALFEARSLEFSFNQVTENRTRPDFLFPSIGYYRDPASDPSLITVLGAKTTCKDRWRQVLNEAKRVDDVHLVTLEAPISENQTVEMVDQRVQLVVPSGLHRFFSPSQRHWLMTLQTFMEMVADRENMVKRR